MPGTMVSDNGKTFKSKELKEFCVSKGIKWIHIVERSPWSGGFYERLVRSIGVRGGGGGWGGCSPPNFERNNNFRAIPIEIFGQFVGLSINFRSSK